MIGFKINGFDFPTLKNDNSKELENLSLHGIKKKDVIDVENVL